MRMGRRRCPDGQQSRANSRNLLAPKSAVSHQAVRTSHFELLTSNFFYRATLKRRMRRGPANTCRNTIMPAGVTPAVVLVSANRRWSSGRRLTVTRSSAGVLRARCDRRPCGGSTERGASDLPARPCGWKSGISCRPNYCWHKFCCSSTRRGPPARNAYRGFTPPGPRSRGWY